MSLQAVSQDTLQDVVALQGNEIIRLKAALANAQERIICLQAEIAEISEEKETPAIKPNTLSHEESGTPSYDGVPLQSFDGARSGRNVEKYLKLTLTSMGCKKPAHRFLRISYDKVRWETGFDEFSLVKPEKRKTKWGSWHNCTNRKVRGSLHVIACLASGTFYLGCYQGRGEELLAAGEFTTLPQTVQETVLSWSTSRQHYAKVRTLLERGEVPLRRFVLRRSGFDHALYDSLLRPAPTQTAAMAGGSAGHGVSDSEGDGDDNDEE
ncbi:hypothetical protein PsYK624_156860 [Phanerochaete sordida]|uniref:Uncharacterized protein n=1 Tax=Phanerochaete sordida TaxID=48140 RepID=A0A9P3GTH6_9APHY|nr:hypothetical protein PsYK624_156860 [Phanerochaete sordida]